MPLPNFLKNIFSGGASELVKTISNTVDEFNLSKEEKEKFKIEILNATNAHLEKMAALSQAELESYLKDSQDARSREVQIATSDKAPLINKIVTPVLAIFLIALTFVLFYIVLFRQLGAEKDIVIYILGVLSAVVTQVISYYFGSSASSKANGDAIRDMIKK